MKKKRDSSNPNKIEGVQVEHCRVLEALGGDKFKVKLPNNHEMICYIKGKLRKNFIKILPDDFVTIEMTPYDLINGKIVYREK